MAPIGTAVAAGALVAATLPPHWRARGAPWVLGYGKNVDLAAVASAFVAGAASRWLVTSRFGRWAVGAVATIGFGVVVRYADLPAVFAGWPQLAFVVALVTAKGEGIAFEVAARVNIRQLAHAASSPRPRPGHRRIE